MLSAVCCAVCDSGFGLIAAVVCSLRMQSLPAVFWRKLDSHKHVILRPHSSHPPCLSACLPATLQQSWSRLHLSSQQDSPHTHRTSTAFVFLFIPPQKQCSTVWEFPPEYLICSLYRCQLLRKGGEEQRMEGFFIRCLFVIIY